MEQSILEIYIDKILTFLELCFYFLLIVFIMNIVLHVTFMIGIQLNVVQPIKNMAASKNALIERDLDLIFDNFEGGLTSYSLGSDSDIEIYLSDNRMYVDNDLAERVDDHNRTQPYGSLTSYNTIQQTQYAKAKLSVPLRVDFLGLGEFEYIRDFDINVIALQHHDHLPAYSTLSRGTNSKDRINLPVVGDEYFNYSFFLKNNLGSFENKRNPIYTRPTGIERKDDDSVRFIDRESEGDNEENQ